MSDFPISARAAAVDLDRARRWYEEKLGLVRERGVVLVQYDLGEVQIVDGPADFGEAKAAWFTDSEGNTYELSEIR